MKNIFVEGIQGSGKSTLINNIVKFNPELHVCSDKLEENIKIIQKERCDENGNELWYQMMLEYLVNSPYGRKHECSAFEDMISHFKHRQELNLKFQPIILLK